MYYLVFKHIELIQLKHPLNNELKQLKYRWYYFISRVIYFSATL